MVTLASRDRMGLDLLVSFRTPAGQPTALGLEGVDVVRVPPSGRGELAVAPDMDVREVPATMASLSFGPP